MAPKQEATSLTQRKALNVLKEENTDPQDEQLIAIENNAKKLSELKDNEICIEGLIYDITDFVHPGGDSIHMFGSNDVTVTYKMVHPYHTRHHLEKMKLVGKVTDWVKEYEFDTEFEREVKREVFKIVRRGREFGTPGYFVRAFFYISLLIVLQALWVVKGSSWQLAVALGVSQALIGLNVQHDGNHGAVSRNPFWNDLFGFGADFIGGNKWTWMEQHWTHHSFTNHVDRDPDAFASEPLVLFHDYPKGDAARTLLHSFQMFYFFPVMSLYWLSKVFNPEILSLHHVGAGNAGLKQDNRFIKSRVKYAILLRAVYIYLNIVCPFQHHGFTFTTALHILGMGMVESLTLATLFSLSHNFEHSDRDPTKEFRENGKHICWFKSQVETSCTYGGMIAGMLTGGLNFQVEHHLFPRMSSAWYPYIAPTVREVCKKHGVNYAYYPWIWQNLYSTLKYVHSAGTGSNWKDLVASDPLSGKN
jgi:fatty acid desaturase (delta-4 desaturase)